MPKCILFLMDIDAVSETSGMIFLKYLHTHPKPEAKSKILAEFIFKVSVNQFATGIATCLLYGWLLPTARGPIYIFTALELLTLALAGYAMEEAAAYGFDENTPACIRGICRSRRIVANIRPGCVVVCSAERAYFPIAKSTDSGAAWRGELSLYLVHAMVFVTLVTRTTIIGWPAFAIGALLSQVLAFALFRMVENPARQYVKRALARDRTSVKKGAALASKGDGAKLEATGRLA
jgi:peptidoglycan/LPS O-acetylase OafA/YrhL